MSERSTQSFIKELLRQPVDVEIVYTKRKIDTVDAIFEALFEQGSVDLINELLDHYVLPKSDKVFRLAIDPIFTDILKRLLRHKLLDPSYGNNAALNCASTRGNVEAVKILLSDKRVAANLSTALIHASYENHTEIVKLLLDRGADPSTGKNVALDKACDNNNVAIVKLLLATGKVIMDDIFKISRYNSTGDIRKLLTEYAFRKSKNIECSSINMPGIVQVTIAEPTNAAFITAVESENVNTVKNLLKNDSISKSDLNVALMIASTRNYTSIVKVLLKYGASPSHRNNFALEMSYANNNVDMMKMLLATNRVVCDINFYGVYGAPNSKDVWKLLRQYYESH